MVSVLIFIFVLVVLVVGHELGHFFAAKKMKMRVLEFGVGFPPKIWGRRFGNSETEYTLNWIPFGGFVRIFGEDPKEAGQSGSFSEKSARTQALVLFAGPGANILIAFLLFTTSFAIGAPSIIESDAEAASARNVRVLVSQVLPDSPAANAGIQSGDVIRAITTETETITIATPENVQSAVARGEGDVVVSVVRNNMTTDITVTPQTGLLQEEPERRALGIATARVGVVSYAPLEALHEGLKATYKNFLLVVTSFGILIAQAVTFSADVSNLAGPVGIATLTGEAASFGFGALLSFAALLSLNLGVINLFPFPALDGGRLLFLGVETVTRRKIPVNVAGAFNTVGFALLIILMVAVTVGDVGRLMG